MYYECLECGELFDTHGEVLHTVADLYCKDCKKREQAECNHAWETLEDGTAVCFECNKPK